MHACSQQTWVNKTTYVSTVYKPFCCLWHCCTLTKHRRDIEVSSLSPYTNWLRYSTGAKSKFINIFFSNTFQSLWPSFEVTKQMTPSSLREERAKHLARRKEIQNPPKPVSILSIKPPSDNVPIRSRTQFKEWEQLNDLDNRRKIGLFVQPYRPPTYLITNNLSTKSVKSRSAPSHLSDIPIPQPVVEKLRTQKPFVPIESNQPNSTPFGKPFGFLPYFPSQGSDNPSFNFEDPPSTQENVPTIDKPIGKRHQSKKGKKIPTKWHCSICSLRYLSSEKQLNDHIG